MSWKNIKQDGCTVYARPLRGKEKLFYSLVQNQRGLANFTAHVKINARYEPSAFEERLKFACTFTTSIHPILLATVAPLGDNGQIVCQIPARWDEAREVVEARIKRFPRSSNDQFFETIYANEMAELKRPLFFWMPLGESMYELVLATPHCLLDARAATLILQDVLKTITSDLTETSASQWRLLVQTPLYILSPPTALVKSPVDVSPETFKRCVEKWRTDGGSKIVYGLTPKTMASCPEGTTRRVMHTFSQEETANLFKKFKSLGVTNNTAVQAALWLATVTVAPPTDEHHQTHHCASMFTVDARGLMKPEWNNYIGVGLCDASVSCPLEVAVNPDRKAALINMMAKITDDMKFWKDSGAMLEVNEALSEGGVARSHMLAEKGIGLYNAFLANFGILDNSMARVYGNEEDSNSLEVLDIAVFSRVSQPQYFTRVWTFNKKYNVVINFNDHYFEQAQMEEFLKAVIDVLRWMLTI